MIIPVALGILAWTLAEYLLHRWVGHSSTSRLAFAREHREHHRQRQYFAPWSAKLQLAGLVLAVLGMVILPAFGPTAFVFLASFIGTWLVYEGIHRDLHVRAPRTAVGRFLRRHHMRHHHVDPTTNHGVTSPIWDIVFGTLRSSARVRIAGGKAPYWLADAPEGAPCRAGFDIVRRGASPGDAGDQPRNVS